MAAVGPGLGAGEIAIEVQEMRAWHVCRVVRTLARGNVGKHVPAIDNDVVRVAQVRGKFGGGYDGRVVHGWWQRTEAHGR